MNLLRHIIRTPTFTFTLIGVLSLEMMWFKLPADLPAFIFLMMAGGGTSIAFYELVERRGQLWEWKGIREALRAPDGLFWAGFLGHIPQLTIALWIALGWR